MRPIEALLRAIQIALLSSKPPKPGVIINSCNTEIRDALKQLTSDEAATLRGD